MAEVLKISSMTATATAVSVFPPSHDFRPRPTFSLSIFSHRDSQIALYLSTTPSLSEFIFLAGNPKPKNHPLLPVSLSLSLFSFSLQIPLLFFLFFGL
jgi:hypothetical protein